MVTDLHYMLSSTDFWRAQNQERFARRGFNVVQLRVIRQTLTICNVRVNYADLNLTMLKVTIREALQELVAWSQTAELKLVDHEENGRRTALIRDWSDVFLELGDKQSLLASLKESQFFKAFEDQGIAYEVAYLTIQSAE